MNPCANSALEDPNRQANASGRWNFPRMFVWYWYQYNMFAETPRSAISPIALAGITILRIALGRRQKEHAVLVLPTKNGHRLRDGR